MGPQHPSTHGVLRFEVVTDGEIIVDVVPHLGYLHRCFEKHAQSLPFNQTIPFVDRLDYLAAMNSEHAFVMGVEKMLGIQNDIPKANRIHSGAGGRVKPDCGSLCRYWHVCTRHWRLHAFSVAYARP